MKIVLAGASGFIGRHLRRALHTNGHDVIQLVRRAPTGDDQLPWDPYTGVLPTEAFTGADAVINLAGAGVGDRRWTTARKQLLHDSRIIPTSELAAACRRHQVPTLINASAVGIYGDRAGSVLTEDSPPGIGFLAQLCQDWEAAATGDAGSASRLPGSSPAVKSQGATVNTASAAVGSASHTRDPQVGTPRTVLLRTGLVLGPDGGLLPRMTRLTRFGLGGALGSGEQYWPWISLADHVAAVLFLLQSDVFGPVNLTAPEPVTNAVFTRELGAVLRRPTPWRIPRFALRAALGGFAGEIVGSQRAVPRVLEEAGFSFLHRDLGTTLRTYAL